MKLITLTILLFLFSCSPQVKPLYSVGDCLVDYASYRIIAVSENKYALKTGEGKYVTLSHNYVHEYMTKVKCLDVDFN